ncbi:MAG: UvrD-helicase domain-containing protein [Bacteroidia bacterium]|nr:UvrD-helicase domain-containing protein [Bacteroidia bacterium]
MTLKVYRSSAGSGKTFTLALEYLSLALDSPGAFRSILGVTFTNKAANEMKSRILKFLQLLADEQHPDTKLRALLLDRMRAAGHGSDEQIRDKASKVFHQILHNYADFSVSTIDAFVYRLVRTFSRDVALPTQFELVLESSEIISRLVDRLFDRVGIDPKLTDHLLVFLIESMDDQNNHNIEFIIRDFCKELLSERSVRHASALSAIDDGSFSDIRLALRTEYHKLVNELLAYAENALNLLSQYGVSPEALANGKSGIGIQLVKLVETKDFNFFFEKSNVKKALAESAEIFSKGAASKIPAGLETGLRLIFADIAQWHRQKYMRAFLLGLIIPGLNTLALTSQLYRETEQMISEEQIVHISEFNKRVAGLLSESGVPFIYERLGERYQHFLLDEFQDTSILQWSNFLPLIENGLSGGHTSLIVGDAKQAIYRWRNGEVELFVRLPEVYPADELPHIKQYASTLKNHYELYNLSSNFRSHAGIIDFNNRFFQFVSDALPERFKPIYADARQDVVKQAEAGYVSVSFIEAQDELKADEVTAQRLVTRLQELFSEGFAPQDIAILCRKNKECRALARALTAEGIKIVSSESLQLNSSVAVNAVIAAMRSLSEGVEKLFNAELVSSLAAQRRNPALRNEAFQPGYELTATMFTDADLSDKISSHSIYDLAESIIHQLGLDTPYDPFLQAFLDKVLEYQMVEGEGLPAFLRHWEEELKTTSIVLTADREAVSVLTVHKAKGLEFPVVIVPFAEFFSQNKKNSRIWVDLEPGFIPPLRSVLLRPSKKMEGTPFEAPYLDEKDKSVLDTINLTYVAYTRAEERLYLMFPRNAAKSGSGISGMMKGFLQQNEMWDNEKTEYSLGNAVSPLRKKTLKAVPSLVAENMMTGRKRGIPTKTPVSNSRARSFGIRVHKVLSSIFYSADIEAVVKKETAQGTFTSDESLLVSKFLKALAALPELSPGFEPPASVFNEYSFTDGIGNVYRVDRYVELIDKRMIIEYKTGDPETAHLEQLKQYVQLVSKIEEADVKGFLVYLSEEPQLIKI